MRVALVCPYDWSRPGGVRGHVQQLAAQLARHHEVRVFAPASVRPERRGGLTDPPLPDPGLQVVGRPFGIRFNQSVAAVAPVPSAGWRVVRALREFAPQVVHVHEPLVPAVALAATATGPAPVVGTFHAWAETQRLYHMAAPLARRVARRLAVRIAVSAVARNFAAEALGLPLTAFRVVPNGVDVAAFSRAEPLPELVDRSRPLLLFVGRLEPRKGLDVLIRAFVRLRASQPRARLCVVGDGPGRGRWRDLPPSVREDVLFAGSVSDADKPRYHASADVFVAPNTTGESFGIILLEAMAAGLPVVASDIPGFRPVVRDGRQGRLVPPGDALALCDTLESLLTNDRLRAAMAAEGRLTAARHDWAIIAAQILDLYREAGAGRSAGAGG